MGAGRWAALMVVTGLLGCATGAAGAGGMAGPSGAGGGGGDCSRIEVYLDRVPDRAYTVLGETTLTTSSSQNVGDKERAVRPMACEAGADAVLLSLAGTRSVGRGVRMNEYRVVLVEWAKAAPAAPTTP